MRRGWMVVIALLCVLACAPRGSAVPDYFSEDFALGAPLRDPVGALGTAWQFSDGGRTSQYDTLINARNPGAEVHATAGVGGTPALYSSDDYSGRTIWATWALSGTAASRALAPAGPVVLKFDVKFGGANGEGFYAALYSDVAMNFWDVALFIQPRGLDLVCFVEYLQPTGGGFATEDIDTDDYVIGAVGDWRDGAAWHHVEMTLTPGTVTAWTPGSALTVSADGSLAVTIDNVEVINVPNIPLILNSEGQSAEESSPGSWEAATTNVEANVNRLSILDLNIISGSATVDNVTLGGTAPAVSPWVDIADFLDMEIDAADYPGGLARVLCELWTGTAGSPAGSPGPTIQARLWNRTDGVSCGESEVVIGTDPITADFAVALTAGIKRYREQVTSDTELVDLYCIGAGLVA